MQDLDFQASKAQQASCSSMSALEHQPSWLAAAVDFSGGCERSSPQPQPGFDHSQGDSSGSMTGESVSTSQHTEGAHQLLKQPSRRELHIHSHSSRVRCHAFLAVILCSLLLAPATQAARSLEAATVDPQVCSHVASHAMLQQDMQEGRCQGRQLHT